MDNVPRFENIVLARVYSGDKLIGIFPRTVSQAASLDFVLQATDREGKINPRKLDTSDWCVAVAEGYNARRRFFTQIPASEDFAKMSDGSGNMDPKKLYEFINGPSPMVPDWLKQTFILGDAYIKTVESNVQNFLIKLESGKFSENIIQAASDLLEAGQVRTAEKIFDGKTGNGIWVPQTYAFDCMNALFDRENIMLGDGYFDKVPLKTKSWGKMDFGKAGVRFVPASFTRAGCYIGSGTTIMAQAVVNVGAYIAGEKTMIDCGARVSTGAQLGKRVKIGGGSGLEGVLEPRGMMPTIIEDDVTIGAMCEVCGIIEEGAGVANGVKMSKQKKIFDLRTGEFQEPRYIEINGQTYAVPYIPKGRLAIGGSYNRGKINIDCTILHEKDASDSSINEVPKNESLYMRI
jgi:2,3,4,5-tetrahydropyridine-2,6-dicarboxylate N-succinyltransferase